MPFGVSLVSNFNPRSREGSDQLGYPWPITRHNFNPRSREGSDSAIMSWTIHPRNFNPRSREGSDPAYDAYNACLAQFQSTLP